MIWWGGVSLHMTIHIFPSYLHLDFVQTSFLLFFWVLHTMVFFPWYFPAHLWGQNLQSSSQSLQRDGTRSFLTFYHRFSSFDHCEITRHINSLPDMPQYCVNLLSCENNHSGCNLAAKPLKKHKTSFNFLVTVSTSCHRDPHS